MVLKRLIVNNPFFRSTWRWVFLRKGRLAAIAIFLSAVVLVMLAQSLTGLDSDKQPPGSSPVIKKKEDSLPEAHRTYTTTTPQPPPSLEELERQNRTDMFDRIVENNKANSFMRGEKRQIIKCMLPKPWDMSYDSNKFAFHQMPPLVCPGNRMFYVQDGKFILNKSVIGDPKRFDSCWFFQVKNYDDDLYFYSQPVIRSVWPFEGVTVEHDFVRIQCFLTGAFPATQEWFARRFLNRQKREEEGYFGIFNDEELHHRRISSMTDVDKYFGGFQHGKAPGEKLAQLPDDDDDLGWNSYDEDELVEQNFPNLDSEWIEFDQFSVQVAPKPEVFQRIAKIMANKKPSAADPEKRVNVLMLGLQSVSHLAFRRVLPRSYRYLREGMGAVVMENYNVVGEFTKDELIPLLTGKPEEGLPDVQSWKYNAELMNAYPFVWKLFQDSGYATLFAEDDSVKSLFNTGFYGFGDSPTDHYMRPFWQAVYGSQIETNSPKFCTGGLANHRQMLDYVESFFEAYKNVSRFAFAFFRELSQSSTSVNPVQYLDDDLLAFLRRFEEKKFLEDTLVVVFSDRGVNDYLLKSTVLAKMEERMPMMALAFPRFFRQRYPKEHAWLEQNARRLTVPHDVHETLLDLLNTSRFSHPRPPKVNETDSKSLLQEVPLTRTCEELEVAPYWCVCMVHMELDPGEPLVKSAVTALLGYVNARTEEAAYRKKCLKFELGSVRSALLVVPPRRVLKFTHDGKPLRWPNYTSPFDVRVAPILLQIRTDSPCDAIYHAYVMADFRNFTRYRYDVIAEEVKNFGYRIKHSRCLGKSEAVAPVKPFCCCRNYPRV